MQTPEIKKVYARYSRIYDVIFSRWFYPRQRHVSRALDLGPGQRVLDVGVGTGISLPLYPRQVMSGLCAPVGPTRSIQVFK